MPAVSQAQQALMGMAYAYKKGELKDVSEEVKKLADSMTLDQLHDFASTSHKGLPVHKEEYKLMKKTIKLSEVIRLIENKTGKKVVLKEAAEKAPKMIKAKEDLYYLKAPWGEREKPKSADSNWYRTPLTFEDFKSKMEPWINKSEIYVFRRSLDDGFFEYSMPGSKTSAVIFVNMDVIKKYFEIVK